MLESQTNVGWDVLLDLGRPIDGPLHERVTSALRTAIREQRISAGQLLPPSRDLATDLGCSRWTVTEAYGQLTAEGYLEARPGSGTRVRWSGDDNAPDERRSATPRPPVPRYDLAPGLPDLRAFPRRRWADAVRAQATTVPFDDLGFQPTAGHIKLRELLAAYLRRSRGVSATPDDVTICTSVTEGVRRMCHVLMARGMTAMGFEEPGWTRLRDVVRASGMETVPIPVDDKGLRVDLLAGHADLRAVLTTPAHQFPLGAVLAPERRASLLQWARRVDGVVLEDDYDAEFRYDRRPVGTLQGLDPSRVVLLKSLSKMLSPAIGIGWLVAPPHLSEQLRADDTSFALPPVLDQLAFAALLESGAYDRHLRGCRRRYRHRRDTLVDALTRSLPGTSITGIAAGLHLVVGLDPDIDTAAVAEAAARRSLRIATLDGYYAGGTREGGGTVRSGLVLGYGNLADTAVNGAVHELTTAIAGSRGAPSAG